MVVAKQPQELPHTKGGHQMNHNTIYVGMDVHKENFSLFHFVLTLLKPKKLLITKEQKLITRMF